MFKGPVIYPLPPEFRPGDRRRSQTNGDETRSLLLLVNEEDKWVSYYEPQNSIVIPSQTPRVWDTRGLPTQGHCLIPKDSRQRGAERNAHSVQTGRFQRERGNGSDGQASSSSLGRCVDRGTGRKSGVLLQCSSLYESLLSGGWGQRPFL